MTTINAQNPPAKPTGAAVPAARSPNKPGTVPTAPHPSLHDRAKDELQHAGGGVDPSFQHNPKDPTLEPSGPDDVAFIGGKKYPGIDVQARPKEDSEVEDLGEFVRVGAVSVRKGEVKGVKKGPEGTLVVATGQGELNVPAEQAEKFNAALGLSPRE